MKVSKKKSVLTLLTLLSLVNTATAEQEGMRYSYKGKQVLRDNQVFPYKTDIYVVENADITIMSPKQDNPNRGVFTVGENGALNYLVLKKNSKLSILNIPPNPKYARGLYIKTGGGCDFWGDVHITKNNNSHGRLFQFSSDGAAYLEAVAHLTLENRGPGECIVADNNARYHSSAGYNMISVGDRSNGVLIGSNTASDYTRFAIQNPSVFRSKVSGNNTDNVETYNMKVMNKASLKSLIDSKTILENTARLGTCLIMEGGNANLHGVIKFTSLPDRAVIHLRNRNVNENIPTVFNIVPDKLEKAKNKNRDVMLKGNVINEAFVPNSALRIEFNTPMSYLKGDNILKNNGLSSNLIFTAGSKWTGNNYAQGRHANSVTNIHINGRNTLWEGNNKTEYNRVNIKVDNGGSWLGNNEKVDPKANVLTHILVKDKDTMWKGHNQAQGNPVNIDLDKGGTWTGNNEGRDANVNISLRQGSAWNGDNLAHSSTPKSLTGILIEGKGSVWKGNDKGEGNPVNIRLDKEAQWFGDSESSNKRVGVSLKEGSIWTGNSIAHSKDNNGIREILIGGKNSLWKGNSKSEGSNVTVRVEQGGSWFGDNTCNNTALTVSLRQGSVWNGNNLLIGKGTHAVSNIHLSGKATLWKGHNKVEDDAVDIRLREGSKWEGNNFARCQKQRTETAILVEGKDTLWKGDNLAEGSAVGITLDKGGNWVGNNEAVNGPVQISLSQGAIWEGNSYAHSKKTTSPSKNSHDNVLIDLSGKNTFWLGNNRVEGCKLKVRIGAGSRWKGDNYVLRGDKNAEADILVEGKDTSWEGHSETKGRPVNIRVDNGGSWIGNNKTDNAPVSVSLDHGSSWRGENLGQLDLIDVSIKNNSVWHVTGKEYVNVLAMDTNGTVDMAYLNQKKRNMENGFLIVSSLKGNGGNFILKTNLGEGKAGDQVYISKVASKGTFGIQIDDASLYNNEKVGGVNKVLVVTDEDKNPDFKLEGRSLNKGGLWTVKAPKVFKGEDGKSWYVGYEPVTPPAPPKPVAPVTKPDKEKKEFIEIEIVAPPKLAPAPSTPATPATPATNTPYGRDDIKTPSPDALVYLANRGSVYNLWTSNGDNARSRLGELRQGKDKTGIWARTFHGKLSSSIDKENYHGLQIGFDKAFGDNILGIAYEGITAKNQYTYGLNEGKSNVGLIYYTMNLPKNQYLDFVGRVGRISSRYTSYGPFPDKGEYSGIGGGISLEYGRTLGLNDGYFVEPSAQLAYSYLPSGRYVTERKASIEEAAVKSLRSRVGIKLGRNLPKDSSYYVKLDFFREMQGERSAKLLAANGERMFVRETGRNTWSELGLGGKIMVNPNTLVYGEIEQGFGGKVRKDWHINAGLRWKF